MTIQQMKAEIIEVMESKTDIIAYEYFLEEIVAEWFKSNTEKIKAAIEEALIEKGDSICLVISTDDIVYTTSFTGEVRYCGTIKAIIGSDIVGQMSLLDRIESGKSKESRDKVNFNLFFDALIKRIVDQLDTELIRYSYFNGEYFVHVRI
jgi:hypothetical protein